MNSRRSFNICTQTAMTKFRGAKETSHTSGGKNAGKRRERTERRSKSLSIHKDSILKVLKIEHEDHLQGKLLKMYLTHERSLHPSINGANTGYAMLHVTQFLTNLNI